MDIKSQSGWFRIIYALGQEAGNMPDFSQGKCILVILQFLS